jgi:pimeloyl-ACP methyl ester carboxylesterase
MSKSAAEPAQSKHIGETGLNGWKAIDWPEYTRSKTVPSGATISYVDIGEGPGPVLVLIHGLGGSWQAWLENIAPLAAHHRVIAVDLPGFGQSPMHPKTVSVAAYACSIEELCRGLGLESLVAIGSSLGGWISAELARRAPDLCVGLVLIDAAGIPPTRRERMKVVTILRLADRMTPLGCRYRETLINNPARRRRALKFAIWNPDRLDTGLVATLLPERPNPVFRTVLNSAIQSWSESWCDRIAELNIPALVLWGDNDAQLPVRHGHEWVRLLAGARLVVVPEAGHLPMLEQPATVNFEVQRFLAGLSSSKDADHPEG